MYVVHNGVSLALTYTFARTHLCTDIDIRRVVALLFHFYDTKPTTELTKKSSGSNIVRFFLNQKMNEIVGMCIYCVRTL